MERYRITNKGYKFDKFVFWGAVSLVFLMLIGIMARHNFDFKTTNVYIKCEDPEGCINPLLDKGLDNCRMRLRVLWSIPLYTTEDCRDTCTGEWCKWEVLPKGEYGTPPDPMLKNAGLYSWGIVILAVLLNHLVHNKGKKFDLGFKEYFYSQFPKLKGKIKFKLDEAETEEESEDDIDELIEGEI